MIVNKLIKNSQCRPDIMSENNYSNDRNLITEENACKIVNVIAWL